MRDFLKDPACRPEELGAPIPDSPHSVSVCLPTWADVIGYEESEERVLDAMKAGYPRFFRPLAVREWESRLLKARGGNGKMECLIFPTDLAAERCRRFIEDRHDGWKVGTGEVDGGATAVFFPHEVAATASKYWRFCGEGVSSRQAEGMAGEGSEALQSIRERVAACNGQRAEDVYLYPSGMAGVAALHRALLRVFPGCRTAQLDFPYVDVLKVQENFGNGAWFKTGVDSGVLEDLANLSGSEPLAGIFCEIASNPLLRTPDLGAVKTAAQKGSAPLVVDDTVATSIDVEAARFADVITTSLTKAFSGEGNVLAGAVTLCRESEFYDRLKPALEEESDCLLWSADADVLAGNSADFADRTRKAGATAERLVAWLRERPEVAVVHYPDEQDSAYALVRRSDGGFGSLFSVELKDPETRAPRFHDALRISKGPSLGNNFSLACAYTLLAHYEELEWAEKCGVDSSLIRIWTGLEPEDELIDRFRVALEGA